MLLEKIQKENDIKQLKAGGAGKAGRRNPSVSCGENQCHRRASGIESRVVELTMALHLAFELPQDKMIWDVGHQSYTHKILTGRAPDLTI